MSCRSWISEQRLTLFYSGGFSNRIWSQLRHGYAAPHMGISLQTGETPASTRPQSGRKLCHIRATATINTFSESGFIET